MTMIVSYFPFLTFIILILGVTYLFNRNHWTKDESSFRRISLTLLGIIISCSVFNGILLTAPILDGRAFVNNIPELLMWIWPDLLVVVALVADMIRTLGFHISRE